MRCSASRSRSAGTVGTTRSPASVLVADRGTRMRAPAMSTCGASTPQRSDTRKPARIGVSTTTRRGTSLRLRAPGASFQISPRRTLRMRVSETTSSWASATAGRLERRMRATLSHVSPRAPLRSGRRRAGSRRSARFRERAPRALGLRRGGLQGGDVAGQDSSLSGVARHALGSVERLADRGVGNAATTRLIGPTGPCVDDGAHERRALLTGARDRQALLAEFRSPIHRRARSRRGQADAARTCP